MASQGMRHEENNGSILEYREDGTHERSGSASAADIHKDPGPVRLSQDLVLYILFLMCFLSLAYSLYSKIVIHQRHSLTTQHIQLLPLQIAESRSKLTPYV
jgi:hypothetical protein